MSRCFLTAALLIASCAAAAAQGWDDRFDGPELHARWTWRVPVAGPTFSLKDRPGWLRIRVPQRQNGYNHWNQPVPVDEAPQLRTTVPAGDWELEAKVQVQEVDPGANFHAGLVVGLSDAQILTWGPFAGPGLPGGRPDIEAVLEPTGASGYARARGDARDVVLRLSKVGYTCIAAVRRGNGDWVEGGIYTLLRPPTFIGIICKTFLDGPGVTFDVDYIRLLPREAQAEKPLAATVRVNAGAQPVAVSASRYGHFIEHLGRCVYGGLWAEMLTNRKMAGEAAENGVVEGWTAVGAGEGVTFAADNRVFYAPVQSQRIERAAAGEPCGISQGGLELRPRVGLTGRVVLRREGNIGPVTVSLRQGNRVIGERQLEAAGADWQTLRFTLPGPDAAVADATFSVTFRGAGRLWIGALSLMPEDNVDGWRKDVLDLAKELQPPVIRWPGGHMASGYRWEDGVGPVDQRPVRWERAWGAWEPNDVGTHEFLRLCELLGAQPYIVVNAGEGDAREAARWVEYCNGAATSPQGRLRAANGHPEPFRVPVWGIGNEIYARGELGSVGAPQYALRAVEFALAMRAVDPNIRLVGVGVDGDGYGEWNRRLLSVAGAHLDHLSLHFYHSVSLQGDALNTYGGAMAGAMELERVLQRTADVVAKHAAPGKAITLALDEWNLWPEGATSARGVDVNHSLASGLFACSVFNVLTRQAERVGLANLALLTNVLGAIRTTPTRAYPTPLYLAFRLHAGRSGAIRPSVAVDTPRVALPAGGNVPGLDAAATLSGDRQKLYLSLVNRHPTQPAQVRLEIEGFRARSGEWAALVGDEIAATNTAEKPDAVRIETRPLRNEELQLVTVPAHTAAVVTLSAR